MVAKPEIAVPNDGKISGSGPIEVSESVRDRVVCGRRALRELPMGWGWQAGGTALAKNSLDFCLYALDLAAL